jgi:hypothetical protein
MDMYTAIKGHVREKFERRNYKVCSTFVYSDFSKEELE